MAEAAEIEEEIDEIEIPESPFNQEEKKEQLRNKILEEAMQTEEKAQKKWLRKWKKPRY